MAEDERFPTYDQLFEGWKQMQAERDRLRAALQQIADEPRQPMGDGRKWAYKLHGIAVTALAGSPVETAATQVSNLFDQYPVGTLFQKKEDGRIVAMTPDGKTQHAGDAVETSGVQLCSCRDGARYRFIRQGEDQLATEDEATFAAMWADITLKGYWREAMDNRVDRAMQQLKAAAEPVSGSGKT